MAHLGSIDVLRFGWPGAHCRAAVISKAHLYDGRMLSTASLVHRGRSPRITLHLASSCRRRSSHCCWAFLALRPASCQCSAPHTRWYGSISCRLPRRSSCWSLTCASAHLLLHSFTDKPLRLAHCFHQSAGRRLSGTDVQVLVGFGIASLGTVLGTFVAYAAFKTRLGADGWKASACSTLCLILGSSVPVAWSGADANACHGNKPDKERTVPFSQLPAAQQASQAGVASVMCCSSA